MKARICVSARLTSMHDCVVDRFHHFFDKDAVTAFHGPL